MRGGGIICSPGAGASWRSSRATRCSQTSQRANRKFGDEMLIPRKAQLLLASTLALTMLLPSLGSPIALASLRTAVVLDPTRKIHPMLQAGAELDPTSLVRVIVQKTKADQKTACVSETSTSVLKTSAAVCLVAD